MSFLFGSGKTDLPSTPTAPSETVSTTTSQTSQSQQRLAALMLGGQTNYTSDSGIQLGANTSQVKLIGE